MRYPNLSAAGSLKSPAPRRAAGVAQTVFRTGGEALLVLAAAGALAAGALLFR